MVNRADEYLKRMKTLGYEPSLAGMDDDDIEWELAKMDEAGKRREEPQQPLRTVYRPVDPGLKARILRQFGQPYDENAIDPRESFYIGGWDNGDYEDEPLQMKPAPSVFPPSRGGTGRPDEPSNYWDAVLKRSSDNSGTGNWLNPASGSSGKDNGTNWWVDPKGMFPQYGSDPAAGGDTSGSEARNRYRDNEVVKAPNSGGYMDAGTGRNNEARSGTVDEFAFSADPLKSMSVRGGAKSNTYGLVRQNSDGTPRPHQGVDILAQPGTEAMAVGDGKVIDAGNDAGGYGQWVKIEFEKNGKKHYAFYAHLSKSKVDIGDTVSAGQVIGFTGTSGNAGGLPEKDAHLHFEVHTIPGFGSGLEGRRDPMPHFRTKMGVDENK